MRLLPYWDILNHCSCPSTFGICVPPFLPEMHSNLISCLVVPFCILSREMFLLSLAQKVYKNYLYYDQSSHLWHRSERCQRTISVFCLANYNPWLLIQVVILVMTWLSRRYASISLCRNNVVLFEPSRPYVFIIPKNGSEDLLMSSAAALVLKWDQKSCQSMWSIHISKIFPIYVPLSYMFNSNCLDSR